MSTVALRATAWAASALGAGRDRVVATYRAAVRAAGLPRRSSAREVTHRGTAGAGSPPPYAGGEPNDIRVFHPPGVIRVVTPAEAAAMERQARSAALARPTAATRAAGVAVPRWTDA